MNSTIQRTSVRLLQALVLGFIAISSATAQTVANDATTLEGVTIENRNSAVRGDSLFVSFDVTLQGDFLNKDHALHIVPVYVRAKEQEVRLPHILVNGKQRHRFYRREQSLLSRKERLANKPYAEIVRNNKETQTVAYSYAMRLSHDANKQRTLRIEQVLEDCCDELLIRVKQLPIEAETRVLHAGLFTNTVSFITPQPPKPIKRKKTVSVGITYPLSGYRVLPNFDNNKTELERIDMELHPLFANSDTHQVNSISIKGYTSPEDTYVFNMRLSEQRAEHFKQYLMEKYALGHIANFTTQGMSEDWDGLAKAVEASQMDEKQEILHIINTVDIYDGREKQLMDMKWGDPYRYMAREFFPALRRMEMEVHYTVRNMSADAATSVAQQVENGVSQRAVFDLAKGEMDADLLLVIAKYFPHDATAIINGASAALLKGDLDRAWEYLQQVEDNPMAYNNLGVFCWLAGDTSRAITYFDQAIEANADTEKAKANKEILNK